MRSYQDVILFILSKAYQKVYATFKAKTQLYAMTPIQALVLHALYEEEGLSDGELGKRLVLDGATLSGVLDRMADGGWITKNAAKDDRRVLNIQLTEKSRLYRDTFLKDTEKLHSDVLSSLSEEEKRLLIRMLKDLRKESDAG